MKLYVDRGGTAPSPRRVRIFLAEKGLEVPTETLSLHGENRTPEFRKKNPLSSLPVLELDDGTCIAESISICRYFEGLHPKPSLFGESPLERAVVDMWMRRAELYLYLSVDLSGTGVLSAQSGARFRDWARRSMRFLDRELGSRTFVAGARYSIADVVALSALDFAIDHVGYQRPSTLPHLTRWHEAVSARPRAQA